MRVVFTYVEDREGIFATPQYGPIFRRDVSIMPAESIAGSELDREAEAEGQNPSKNDEVVVPAHLPHDACPRHYSGSNEYGSQDDRAGSHGKNCRAAIGYIVGRHIDALVLRSNGGILIRRHG
ncbi:hypothetical protein DL767_007763 [Monosporascus sp. MG133]|nr:hypothetical protein DL767_007763 [Monosporascus sp. MG133]